MLKATTKQQFQYIKELFDDVYCEVTESPQGINLDGFITFEKMAQVVDFLREHNVQVTNSDFEYFWKEYGRKGSKKNAKIQWDKLSKEDVEKIHKHLPFYIKSTEFMYLKDFERYLRHRMFECVVTNKQGQVLYDPERESGESGYSPQCGGGLSWNDFLKCYLYTGWYEEGDDIPDGYTKENRPDGAKIMLNNGRGTIVWNKETNTWNKG